ncbi:MAG: nitroreductase [Clostridia bacterium]|nr:nitroreductase [Clostridia bacterium]
MSDYKTLFKRKSVRKFDKSLSVSEKELADLTAFFENCVPLLPHIATDFRIVKREQTDCRWGQYAILFFSEKKEGYLENIGYMGEQLDLYLAERNLGACWYGMASCEVSAPEGMDFVIVMSFGKSREEDFRKDRSEFQRKDLAKTFEGDASGALLGALEDARFAPSACNSQPWHVTVKEGTLTVSRHSDSPLAKVVKKIPNYFNRIDVGIYLCFLETALTAHGIAFERACTFDGGEAPVRYTLQ